MFHRIVVPLDGSSLSEAILPEIEHVAADSDAEIILLAVGSIPEEVEQRSGAVAHLDEMLREEEIDLLHYLDTHVHWLGARRVRAFSRVRFGDPAVEIVSCANDEEADAIAMSTHGRTGLDRLIHGSVAGTVLRRTRLPMILLRPDEAAFAHQRSRAERATVGA